MKIVVPKFLLELKQHSFLKLIHIEVLECRLVIEGGVLRGLNLSNKLRIYVLSE